MSKKSEKLIAGKVYIQLFLIGLILTITLFSMNNVNATIYFYQENADSTDCTSPYFNPSYPCSNAIDGDWNTLANSTRDGNDAYSYVNYTKPFGATNESVWIIKSGLNWITGINYQDIVFSDACWDYSPTQLVLRTYSDGLVLEAGAECYNGASWTNFYGFQFSTAGMYEEAMNWSIFISNFTENSQTFNNIATETSLETFILNLTYDPSYYPTSLINLIYNETSYSSTKTSSGLDTIFTTTLSLPEIDVDPVNNSFYWSIALTNTSGTYYYNSSWNNQTVDAINLGECTGTTIINALNITAYDEQTLERFNPFDLKGTLTYSTSIGGSQKNFNFTNLSIAEKDICIKANTTFYINGYLEYSNESYQTKNYHFLDYPISNETTNLDLYMLPTTSSTSFIILVQDVNVLPLANYYVSIFRYDPGNPIPYLVQIIKTDINGQGTAFLETETVDYLFEIFDTDGNLVYTADNQRAIPQSSPYTITFTVGTALPNPITYLANLTGLDYSLSYDKETFEVTYTYSDTNTSFSLASLMVYKTNSSGSDELICDSEKTDDSGVIVCDLTGNSTGSYYATAYIYRGNQIFIDRVMFEIDTFAQTAGLLGVMGAFFIILIAGFMFAYNAVAGIVAVNVAVIAVNLIGFVHFGAIYITAILAISIILLIILERD